MAHGYYNLQGDFVTTSTKAAATAAWREERGYNPIGVFDMGGGEVVDTRGETRTTAPAPAPTTTTAATEPSATINWGDFYAQGGLPQATSRFVEPEPEYAHEGFRLSQYDRATTVAPEQQTSIFGEPIDLSPGANIGLSFADVPLSQGNASAFYSQGGLPQPPAGPSDFYAQGGLPQATAPTTTPSSWTDAELDMLGGMDVQQAINWGANYTGQALFGGWDTRTNEPFTGAFDRTTGELVNPDLMPSLLSPEFATALGISDEQRVMLGYNPDYPYELLQPVSSGGGYAGDSGGGYSYAPSGGGYSPSRGYGYSPSSTLINWRIGF